MLGLIAADLGEFPLARSYLEHGSALYDPQRHRTGGVLYGQDAGVACRSIATFALWMLGYPDQALRQSYEGLRFAQDLSHPFSLALALSWTADAHCLRGEWQAAQQRAEALIALCAEQGFSFWLAAGTTNLGRALVWQGRKTEGIAQMRQGLAARRAIGAVTAQTFTLTALAEAYGEAGQAEEGLSVLAEARAAVDNTGERSYEAELERLKGDLLLMQKITNHKSQIKRQKSEIPAPQSQILEPESQAEACFLKALDIARKQQAKSLELRASSSLARLWQQQGKQQEAHELLAEIYGWFTEGFDTKDLQEAKALLEELR